MEFVSRTLWESGEQGRKLLTFAGIRSKHLHEAAARWLTKQLQDCWTVLDGPPRTERGDIRQDARPATAGDSFACRAPLRPVPVCAPDPSILERK
ncbi:hypothetical protein Rmet_3666 (plasmid) [Cupriavidus metallidurans CH34]|uniref:Uncharacterized protein n=1 Tax=Cupriavidus metallidurans (strain ATCC 43123 / DSM 2839 / NBRC 102507 / CH34) TaxID=266264 RepID=Q1LH38_CUPMC|nr:hypothetical protein Rmet_3666 [Cupriavidus metallidurans CH34]